MRNQSHRLIYLRTVWEAYGTFGRYSLVGRALRVYSLNASLQVCSVSCMWIKMCSLCFLLWPPATVLLDGVDIPKDQNDRKPKRSSFPEVTFGLGVLLQQQIVANSRLSSLCFVRKGFSSGKFINGKGQFMRWEPQVIRVILMILMYLYLESLMEFN